MYLGTGEETPINYFLPLSDPADEAPNDETNLTPRIPNSSPRPSVRHKNRHLAISREPRVVEYIRWCQNDRKNMKKILK